MSSPLIEDLIENKGIPLVDANSVEAFAQGQEHSLLFFTENPTQFPESNDVAVVLPLLLQAFEGRLQAAVVAREAEHALHARFPFDSWPALVMLRRGEYVGAISRMQDWVVYLEEMERLLAAEPAPTPRIKIPVVSEPAGHCH